MLENVECNSASHILIYLGAMVIDARLGSVAAGASLFPPYVSQSSVFWRKPQVRRIRSDISLMSDDELPESNAELFLDLYRMQRKIHL